MKGEERRIKDDFICRSYFYSVEGEEWENERPLVIVLILILWKGRSGTVEG